MYPTTGQPTRNCSSEQAHLVGRANRSRLVSAIGACAARASRVARGGRRPSSGAPAGRLRTRSIPLVFGAATDTVVVAGSAHGVVSRGVRLLAGGCGEE